MSTLVPKIPPYSEEFRREAVCLLSSSGRSIPQLARELGCSPQSLRNWARQIDVDAGKAEGLSSDEREELRRLRRENRILAEEREILSRGLLRQGQRRDPAMGRHSVVQVPPWRPPHRAVERRHRDLTRRSR